MATICRYNHPEGQLRNEESESAKREHNLRLCATLACLGFGGTYCISILHLARERRLSLDQGR